MTRTPHTVVIGAGPVGLTAAYRLTQREAPVEVYGNEDHSMRSAPVLPKQPAR